MFYIKTNTQDFKMKGNYVFNLMSDKFLFDSASELFFRSTMLQYLALLVSNCWPNRDNPLSL